MKKLNDLYDYGLMIYQDSDYFKFSLDSILLSEYTKLHKNDKVIDLCTGNAPVPMILSTKYENEIVGIELQKEIYELAIESIAYNKLENQIKIVNDNVKNAKNYFPGNNFDVITCNPPYFRYNGKSLVNKDEKKSISRHELFVNLSELVETISYLVKDNGKIYMVYQAQRLLELSSELNKRNIFIKEIYFVITNDTNSINIVLIKAIQGAKSDTKVKYLDVRNLKTYKNIDW
jgi:tRNA1(Val) A37 N6-methylase TrmN6